MQYFDLRKLDWRYAKPCRRLIAVRRKLFGLLILGKGKGTQKTVIDLSRKTVEALAEWVIASKVSDKLSSPAIMYRRITD